MYKRIIQYLFLFLGAGALALAQFSLVSALPWPVNNFDLPVVAIIFAFLLVNRDRAWFLAAAMGWFLDILAFHPFGISIMALVLSAVIVYLILENFLTNRSLYSFLLLTVIGILSEAFLSNILLSIFDLSESTSRFFLVRGSFWESLGWSLLLGLVAVGLFFNLLAVVSRRFQPFFLKKR